jgi:hypothetical protein
VCNNYSWRERVLSFLTFGAELLMPASFAKASYLPCSLVKLKDDRYILLQHLSLTLTLCVSVEPCANGFPAAWTWCEQKCRASVDKMLAMANNRRLSFNYSFLSTNINSFF